MNEGERAEAVARAVDALIRGADENEQTSADHENLHSLLLIARERLRTSLFTAKAGVQHEAAVWHRVLERIGQPETGRVADQEAEEFAEIFAMRRRLAEEAALMAEAHRQAVWEKVQARITHRVSGAGLPAILRPFRRRADATAWAAADAAIPPDSADPLPAQTKRRRPATGQMAESTQELARERVWARVTSSVCSQDTLRGSAENPRSRRFVPSLALAAAAATLFVLAIGPLPATGFADHPATRILESIGDRLGARESQPPHIAALPTPDFVNGREVSVAEASTIAGLEFMQPASSPEGFGLTSSRFYPQGISGEGTGIFVLTYSSADSVLTVYQEAAGGVDLAVGTGSATGLTLSDGTEATLIQGAWTADANGVSWSSGADETLVFERSDVRVIAELHGDGTTRASLAEFAGSFGH